MSRRLLSPFGVFYKTSEGAEPRWRLVVEPWEQDEQKARKKLKALINRSGTPMLKPRFINLQEALNQLSKPL